MPISRAEQRRLVWTGKLRKTTGGLTRDDLMLNRTGRIVSKRKSQAASKVNNLGTWLRVRGNKFDEKPANAKKGSNGKEAKAAPKKVAPKKVVKKVAPKKVVKKVAKPKRKLDSKSTVVALKKKAQSGAAKNSKAGAPLSKSKAPEVVAKKAQKKAQSAAEKQKELDQIGLDLFGF